MAISFATARKASLLDVEQERVLTGRWQVDREIVVARDLRQVPDTVEDLARRLGLSRKKLHLIEDRAVGVTG
ncbi:hypothetical protein [Aquicoccus sp. SU-CL01552]|uniref:hypothetical protein n=1 Tax=Aquicoccus sp. SU-CL01552 TaxID=3127656 RepID=UPI0031035377